MKKTRAVRAQALFVCLAMLPLTGCGGGSASGSGGMAYKLGGTLSGLGADQSVSLQDNGGNSLTLSANGSFTFPVNVSAGSPYAVMVQSHTPGIACSVSNGSGTVGSSDVMGIVVSCTAGSERILYSFGASATDGQVPYPSLLLDGAGNLYGTTADGGVNGPYDGTVFKISPQGTETILHSFGASATDGSLPGPNASLIVDSAGNLYGTTEYGGGNQCNCGTVYKISPNGTETILHAFAASPDGGVPYAGLIMDAAGNLYGTTLAGGVNGGGTVFKISAGGVESVLYSFNTNSADGYNPLGGLVMDSAGNLYGTTKKGGYGSSGTVFKITPTGTETILYDIGTIFDGEYPNAGLVMDSAGNLYGTTPYAQDSNGTVFAIRANGTSSLFYAFGLGGAGSAASAQGVAPFGGLILDGAGNLYGTTLLGGANGFNGGTVYKLSPGGTETVLYSFGATATDGSGPNAGVIMDSAGNLYGTTIRGGANGKGAVYVID